jgi:hypothetical protein
MDYKQDRILKIKQDPKDRTDFKDRIGYIQTITTKNLFTRNYLMAVLLC